MFPAGLYSTVATGDFRAPFQQRSGVRMPPRQLPGWCRVLFQDISRATFFSHAEHRGFHTRLDLGLCLLAVGAG